MQENKDNYLNTLSQAIVKIQRRAEKQLDWEKLVDTFVMTEVATRAKTTDSQLVLGRRGTGKTHLFRVFEGTETLKGKVVHYIDCTRLGSGYAGLQLQPKEIAPKYFSSLMNEVGTRLLDEAVRMEAPKPGAQDRILNELGIGLARYLEPNNETEPFNNTFNYRQISESLENILSDLQIDRMFLILDEWAQIPVSAQPYVAEYLKRAILCVPNISVKLLAVSYQCNLSFRDESGNIGIQRGADIPDTLDLDSYFIYEENKGFVDLFFSQVLYNHLSAELNWPLDVSPEGKRKKILELFTQLPAFIELVRAAEGNCRDFLCIFSKAFFEGLRQRREAKAISILDITSAASTWFDNEKYANFRDEDGPRKTLEFIINHVIKGYKSHTFMVEATKSRSPSLTRLLNERVLHKLSGFYSNPDKPGERYELFTVDYGAYIRFKGTGNEPYQTIMPTMMELESLSQAEGKYMVPLDDKRSIRRIVFDPDSLELRAFGNENQMEKGLF